MSVIQTSENRNWVTFWFMLLIVMDRDCLTRHYIDSHTKCEKFPNYHFYISALRNHGNPNDSDIISSHWARNMNRSMNYTPTGNVMLNAQSGIIHFWTWIGLHIMPGQLSTFVPNPGSIINKCTLKRKFDIMFIVCRQIIEHFAQCRTVMIACAIFDHNAATQDPLHGTCGMTIKGNNYCICTYTPHTIFNVKKYEFWNLIVNLNMHGSNSSKPDIVRIIHF